MRIYLSHSRKFDFKKELYEPLENSGLNIDFIFPHKKSETSFDTRSLFINDKPDLVLAEVSNPSLGVGIEIGWANDAEIKIVCIYKNGSKISESLKMVSKTFIEYLDSKDLIEKLKKYE